MSDLDSRARAIVEAGRDADVPSAADRDRIKRAVLVQLAAGAAVASTAAASSAVAASAGLSVAAKLGIAVLTLSLVGGGAAGLLKLRDVGRGSEGSVRVSPGPGVAPVLSPVAEPAAVVPDPPSLVVAGERTRKPERPRKGAMSNGRAERIAAEDQLNAEVEVLKRAREALRLHRPASAIEALVEYDRRFGNGVLGEERRAMAAIATCRAQPGPISRAQADAFVRGAPQSPLRERVREACITPPAANSP
jgi:hypothetical protein